MEFRCQSEARGEFAREDDGLEREVGRRVDESVCGVRE